jgi:hypothetical protein
MWKRSLLNWDMKIMFIFHVSLKGNWNNGFRVQSKKPWFIPSLPLITITWSVHYNFAPISHNIKTDAINYDTKAHQQTYSHYRSRIGGLCLTQD